MRRSRIDQIEHDGMVRILAEQYLRQGYRVAADLPGFAAPPRINGWLPDLVAIKNGETVITEVETGPSMPTHQTFQQFRAFSTFALAYGAAFQAAISKDHLEAARRLAMHWQASPMKWWAI